MLSFVLGRTIFSLVPVTTTNGTGAIARASIFMPSQVVLASGTIGIAFGMAAALLPASLIALISLEDIAVGFIAEELVSSSGLVVSHPDATNATATASSATVARTLPPLHRLNCAPMVSGRSAIERLPVLRLAIRAL